MGVKQIHIEVTQADINKADVKKSSRCVVAQALARTVPDASRISVDVQTIRFTSGGERHVYLTPYPVAGYVVAFDAGDKIHPFSFRLRSDQVVKARRHQGTEAGDARRRVADKVRRRTRSLDAATKKAEAVHAPESSAPPTERRAARAKQTHAREAVVSAEAERDAVVAAYDGQPWDQPADTTKPKATPKVFRRTERSYGMRQLRINQ